MNNYLEDLEFDLFEKTKHIPYIKLIESYIKNYNEDKLALMALQYLSRMSENIQMEVVKIIENHFLSSYALKKLDADCENALLLIMQTSSLNDLVEKYNKDKLTQDEKQFIMIFFRVIALSHAHLVSKNKELRKLLGIRKGIIF